MKDMQLRTRFAPTPSGFLHWGNLFNLCLIWRYARLHQGSILLRIDDLDRARTQEDALTDIFETLNWLGFDWDEGPKDPTDFKRHHSQQLRMDYYFDSLKQIPHYACECSRADLLARGVESYDGHCRHKQLVFRPGHHQLRFLASDPKDDVVVWRKENLAAYHWVSVLDDESFRINTIFRGEDLRESSGVQRELALSAGLSFYPNAQIFHHPLLLSEKHLKLSKSDHAESIREWRLKGKSRAEVFRELSRKAQWPSGIERVEDLLEHNAVDPSTK
jgi:glutamyl-tRNA synthetase